MNHLGAVTWLTSGMPAILTVRIKAELTRIEENA
jgi:hypothetical protein